MPSQGEKEELAGRGSFWRLLQSLKASFLFTLYSGPLWDFSTLKLKLYEFIWFEMISADILIVEKLKFLFFSKTQ